jgi:hypothetical protein
LRIESINGSGQVERRIEKAQRRWDAALDEDDAERAPVVEEELTRLRSERDQRAQAVAHVDALVEEWSGDPDPLAASR